MSHHHHGDESESHRHFSLPFFLITVTSSTLLYLAAVCLSAPAHILTAQLQFGWSLVGAVTAFHLMNAFVEYIFHRYVLHAPLIPGLTYFYKQHTRHHALTRIKLPRESESGESGVVENKYPIIEEIQHEASFFPAYSYLVFAAIGTPIFAFVQWILPTAPIMLGGYLSLTLSLMLYELLHAEEHKPLETTWGPRLEHPRYGKIWKILYGFHLRHHADIHSNESISGFFSLPVADLVFGTWENPNTLYTHRTAVERVEFEPPQPCWIIRQLDELTEKRKAHVRSKAQVKVSD